MARTEYWLQIENQPWDLAPNGINRATGEMFTRGADGLYKPLPEQALVIRRYAANWSAPADQPLNNWDLEEPDPARTKGTIPGATIEAKVGDEIIVHFRNMDRRPGISDEERTHSLHAHGLQTSAVYDGTYPLSPRDPAQANKRGDRVAPGETFDYHYSVPHASNAGVWVYHDQSVAAQASIARGAFGAIIVRGGGEMRPILPTQALHGSGDTATAFARVPAPPNSTEHLLVLHDLLGVGECLNGRQFPGNTPTVIARVSTRVKLRLLNFTPRVQTIHLHGHRWEQENDWADTVTLGSGAGVSYELLEGSAEFGGGPGEWALTAGAGLQSTGSLLVTEGGAVNLEMGGLAQG